MSKIKLPIRKNKTTKKKDFLKQFLEERKKAGLYLIGTVLLVFFVYSFSLLRPWLPFDERVFYKEVLFPIPSRFEEIKEIFQSFAANYHIESMNTFFSSNLTIRSNPIAAFLIIVTSWLFKKNAFFYHLLQLTVHLINTALVWCIFYQITKIINKQPSDLINQTPTKALILVSLFTGIWALHSANIEAILLTTNWTTLLTYTFCLSFILYEISNIAQDKYNISKLRIVLISISFTLTMFLTEYGYTLPFIIFFIVSSFAYRYLGSFKKAVLISLKLSSPYFIGIFLFVFFSIFRPDSPIVNLFSHQPQATSHQPSALYIFVERNLWFTPQIFLHLLKLLFFPKTLSLYQSDLTILSPTIFSPYSIFCTLFYLSFLILPLATFFFLKNKNYKFICFMTYTFYFALFPFLHILLPTYCLSADRYCYFPSFVLLLLILSTLLMNFTTSSRRKALLSFIVASIIITLLTARTLVRIQEWNNPYLLYKSSINVEKSPLYKAHKLIIVADYTGELGKQNEMEESLQKSLNLLSSAIKKFKILIKRYPNQPVTLKQYSLDYRALLLKAVYLASTVKNDNYKEPPANTLKFYEPYIKKYFKLAFTNQIALYAEMLANAGKKEEAKEILESGIKKFPYSSSLLYSLGEYYLQKNDLNNAHEVLDRAYKYFPNDVILINKFYKYYELKNDLPNQAKFAYLLGLRIHDPVSYQRAVQIYLDLNQLSPAKLALKKLIRLTGETPLTLLLSSRYLDLLGTREKVPALLTKAYMLSKTQGKNGNIQVTKSILASLINISLFSGKTEDAKNYLSEFERINDLTNEDRKQIQELKSKFAGARRLK